MVDHIPVLDRMRSAAVVAKHTADHAHIPAARIGAKLPLSSIQTILKLIEHNAYAAANAVTVEQIDILEMMRKVKNHGFANRIAGEAGSCTSRQHRDIMLPTDSGCSPDIVDGLGDNNCQRCNLVEAGSGAVEVKCDIVPSSLST
jgi:hypothetical protein